MDEFAQSRGDDDLFDDEIVPIEPPSESIETISTQVEQVTLDHLPKQYTEPTSTARAHSSPQRARGRGRGRGRGQPRDQQRPGGLADSKYAARPTARPETPPTQTSEVNTSPSEKPQGESNVSKEGETLHDAPVGPSTPTQARPPAVRGDRTATGGVRKPKLTDAELSAKLAAAKERSQNLAAAHARAQADADNFAERERLASEKRVKETAERKAMEGERARNRERKLKALGGREWDAGKDEEQNGNRGGAPVRRQGDFDIGQNDDRHNDLSMYEWKEDRGRGGRGRGRGRGGVRGGRGRGDDGGSRNSNGRDPHFQAQPDVHAEADFPALPTKTGPIPSAKAPISRKDSDRPMGSWADQVESSEAANT